MSYTRFLRPLTPTLMLGLSLLLGHTAASAQAASAASASTSANYIVAVVDSEPITNHDVRQRAARMRQQASAGNVTLKDALENLITEKAMLQYAKETGVESDIPNLPPEQREQLILQRLAERHVPSRIKVSDGEIEQAIRERQAAQSQTNPDIELGHILIPVPEAASADEVARLHMKAQNTLARLQRGEDFAVVAKEVSAGSERDKGGLMGLRPSDRYPTLFVDATRSLAVGGLSNVVRSGAGFHILKLVQKKLSTQITITETRARHILLRPSGQLSASAARARLTDYKRQIEAGKADFARLAQEHSQDASATTGGDLGWVAPGMFVPEFEEVMNRLQPGQIADPFLSRFGVHLVQVLARREAALSERDVQDMARKQVRERKYPEAYQLWSQEVRGRSYIEYRELPQ